MDEMKRIIEVGIRKWMDECNYLFTHPEIDDLVQTIMDEMDRFRVRVGVLDDCPVCGNRKLIQKYDRGEDAYDEASEWIGLVCELSIPFEINEEGEHDWWVVSTAILTGVLMLECKSCELRGIVENPSAQEWEAAFYAPSTPYKWKDKDRVIIMESE